MRINCHIATLGILATIVPTISVNAQPASTMLAQPWPADRTANLDTSEWFQSTANADQSDMNVRLSRYQVAGRWRLDTEMPADPCVAMNWHELTIRSDDPALPERLVDLSLAGSINFDLENDCSLQMILGGGYAGDNAFGDGRAYYGLADLIYTEPLGEHRGYKILLNYNGNRSIFPDVPLPGFIYYDMFNEHIGYALGFPYSSITCRFDDQTSLQATYFLPAMIKAELIHTLNDTWSIYGSYEDSINAYTPDSYPDNRRLMFAQSRVEAGILWHNRLGADLPGIECRIAGGYAFNQEFTQGFDSRNDDIVRDLSDEPYIRISAELRF